MNKKLCQDFEIKQVQTIDEPYSKVQKSDDNMTIKINT